MGARKQQLIKDKREGKRHSGKPAKVWVEPITMDTLRRRFNKQVLLYHQKKQ